MCLENCLPKRIACLLLGIMLLMSALACAPLTQATTAATAGGLVISEVVSSNKRSLIDDALGSPDWIELHNASDHPIDLTGYGLSDNYKKLHKFVFEDVVIPAGGYYVLYAGDNNGVLQTDVPCTGFGLSKSGDYLYLTDAYYGLVAEVQVPALYTDVSYARRADGTYGYCASPTAGAANDTEIFAALDAVFDQTAATQLTISEVMPAPADGSDPWGELYNGGAAAVQLDAFHLSDSEQNVTRWQIAKGTVPAGGYACIYLSGLGDSAADGLHATFKLGKADTTLLLSDLNGNLLDDISWQAGLPKGLAVVKAADGTAAYTAFATFEAANSDKTFTEPRQQAMDASDPVRINEVLPHNTLSVVDGDGDRAEWVELYNASAAPVSMMGYFLSDDPDDLFKWALPEVSIAPDGYLLVLLSGKDRTDGELHASFRLGADEDTLYLTTIDGLRTDAMPFGALLKDDQSVGRDGSGDIRYYAQPTPEAKNAYGFTTADSIGCFDKAGVFISEVSAVPEPKSDQNDWIELYNGAATSVDLTGWYLSDDPDEPEKYQLPQTVMAAQSYFVIEATSHVTRQTLGVATFGIGQGGDTIVLSNAAGELVDAFDTGALSLGVTSGRIEEDNTTERVFFTKPTRGQRNAREVSVGYAPAPTLSETGLYHTEAFDLTIACCDSAAVIRYTTDGAEPTYRAAKYTEPIRIADNTVVRAASFIDGKLTSQITTAVYLFEQPHTVPVVCINIDPYSLAEVMGVTDKFDKVERKAYVSYYEADGTLGVAFPCGIKPKGAGTLVYKQKSLSLNLRASYGQSSVTYPFWEDNPYKTFSALVVRNGGQDWTTARIRDSYASRLVSGMNLDYSTTKPVVVYINGDYRGLFDLNEDLNKEYLVTHYGVDGDAVDVIRRNTAAITGNSTDIKNLRKFALDKDLSRDDLFAEYAERIDVAFFTDYFITQTYICNSDMFNQKYWRSWDGTVKWRPIFYDLDFAFKSYSRSIIGQYFNVNGVPSADQTLTYMDFYIGLKKNADWRRFCCERYAEVVCKYFNSERATAILDEMAAAMRPEMPRHIAKWGKPNTMQQWEDNIADLREIVQKRPAYALESIRTYFGVSEADMNAWIERYTAEAAAEAAALEQAGAQ